MRDKIYFPIALASKQGKQALFVLKADDFVFEKIEVKEFIDECRTHLNLANCKYGDDEPSIIEYKKSTIKLLVYDDDINNLYGMITVRLGNRPIDYLWWIPKDIIDNPDESTLGKMKSILNISNRKQLIKVGEDFKLNYKSDSNKVRLTTNVGAAVTSIISLEEFEALIHRTGTITSEPEPKQVEPEPKQVEPDFGFMEYMIKDLVSRELALKEKEIELKDKLEELSNKEALLNSREEELNEREYYLVKESQADNGIESLDAKVIVDNLADMRKEEVSVETKFLYETLLKVAKYGDRLTIPYEVYKQFSVALRSKALDRNSNYTAFTQLAQIKTDTSQVAGIIAVVEVDNANPVKITIVKEYGIQRFDSSLVQKFETEYRNWRRNRSYMD